MIFLWLKTPCKNSKWHESMENKITQKITTPFLPCWEACTHFLIKWHFSQINMMERDVYFQSSVCSSHHKHVNASQRLCVPEGLKGKSFILGDLENWCEKLCLTLSHGDRFINQNTMNFRRVLSRHCQICSTSDALQCVLCGKYIWGKFTCSVTTCFTSNFIKEKYLITSKFNYKN